MILRLERFAYTPLGTFGWLTAEDAPGEGWYTVERPWLDNKPFVSCIPEGAYRLVPARYNRGRHDTLEVEDVPNRSAILLHRGNTITDIQGCIAIGASFGARADAVGVWDSRLAWGQFVNAVPLDTHHFLDVRFTAQGRIET